MPTDAEMPKTPDCPVCGEPPVMVMSYSREQFDRIKAAAESYGYTVVSKWRPGIENIRLGDIVLSESDEDAAPRRR